MWVWIIRRAYLGLYKTYITLPAETGLIVLIIIVDRVISLRISCGIGHITLSSLQLVPVTRIDNKCSQVTKRDSRDEEGDEYVSFGGRRQ